MKALLGIITALFLSVAPSQAASVVIDSVVGIWTDGTTTPSGQPGGLGTNEIYWGTHNTPQTPNGPSSYTFTGTPGNPSGSLYTLGMFTHNNNPIMDPSLLTATLNVTISGHLGTNLFSTDLNFFFTHNETVNTPLPVGCCADIVTVSVTADKTFMLDGVLFTILGYLADQPNSGTVVTNFLTPENMASSAWLNANIVAPSEVPIPGAVWLFASGLGGLIVLSRRRKKKNPDAVS